MKSRFFSFVLLGVLLFSPTIFFAQENNHSQEIKLCGQYEALEYMRTNDPKRFEQYQKDRIALEKHTNNNEVEKAGTVYTIPVVFHVLHNGGSENISKNQILSALNILNQDFRKQNSDANNVVSQFLPIVGDVEVEFALATIAPDGSCFEGITRTQSSETSNGDDSEAQFFAVVNGNDVYQGIWPHNKYLNIIICKSLISGAAGYTFLPNGNSTANTTNMYYSSIYMLHNYVGAIGTGSPFSSRALTHEVGHWLNLSHTWGNGQIGTCGTDNVADTPTTSGSQPPCDLNQKTCNSSLDNVENFMDYGYCSKMFTNGQVSRMRSAITSSTGGRSNIWKQSNLNEVGATQGGSNCGLDFMANQTAICTGNTINFSASSSSSTITAYSWSFPGGTPSSSTSANPSVTYNSPGNYNVIFTGTTASGNSTVTKNSLISVSPSTPTATLPIVEGFQNTVFPPTNWTIDNGGNANTWVRNSSVGTAPTAGNSAMIDFYTADTRDDIDDLNTPTFSLNGVNSSTLTFDVAYQPYNTTQYYDKLEVLVSLGCGSPFTPVYSKSGTVLQTESFTQTGYTNPSNWRKETIDLSPYTGNNVVQVKFRGTSGWGNYLYIDNVNITGDASGGTADFTVSADKVCMNQSVVFTSTSTGANSWNWDFGQGANPATATGAGPHSVTYSSPGSKTVTLLVNGQSTKNQIINIDDCVGLDDENGLQTLQVYPNPNNGIFTIATSLPFEEVSINDFVGRKVKNIKTEKTNSLQLDLSALSSGTYYLKVKSGTHSKTSRLLIK